MLLPQAADSAATMSTRLMVMFSLRLGVTEKGQAREHTQGLKRQVGAAGIARVLAAAERLHEPHAVGRPRVQGGVGLALVGLALSALVLGVEAALAHEHGTQRHTPRAPVRANHEARRAALQRASGQRT